MSVSLSTDLGGEVRRKLLVMYMPHANSIDDNRHRQGTGHSETKSATIARSLKCGRAAGAAAYIAIIGLSQTIQLQETKAQIVICSGDVLPPGKPFADNTGEQYGLPPGWYRMTVHQSGAFVINNLVAGWAGIYAGGYQPITNPSNNVFFSGIIPANAPLNTYATVTFNVYNIIGQLVLSNSVRVHVSKPAQGWEKVWASAGNVGMNAYPKLYPGDFDGDGDEEILAIGSGDGNNVWMTMFHYQNDEWQWGWSNYGDMSVGDGIYPYRNNLIVGDFDGDGKDEVLGTSSWMTMFHFDNDDWHWGWSNYGDPNAGNGIVPYGNNLIVGDFDGDGKDEVLGTSSWMTMFHFDNDDWHWGWSNYGDPNAGIVPYKNKLLPGDFDNDGRDELLGLSSWATMFHFENENWQWGWSTYGLNSFGGWTYPLAPSDQVLIGNIDSFDTMDEVFFLQRGPTAGWATTMDFKNNTPNWRWSSYGAPPYINFWPLEDLGHGDQANYFLIKALASEPKYLFARRYCGSSPVLGMFKALNGVNY